MSKTPRDLTASNQYATLLKRRWERPGLSGAEGERSMGAWLQALKLSGKRTAVR